MWEHFSHPADVGIRGFGATRQEAFAEAAVAMTAIVCSPGEIRPVEAVKISCQNEDGELLFVDWLNALLCEMAVRKMVFSRFDVEIDGGRLQAQVWGEVFDTARHQAGTEVKAATYHQLKVYKDNAGRWVAQCVVDV